MGAVLSRVYPAPPVSTREVLRYAGAVGSDDAEVIALAESCVKLAESQLTYRVCWREFPIKWGEDEIDLDFTVTASKSLRKCLEGCGAAVLFAATVGIGIDRLIARYRAVSPARSLMLQGVGAERVEALCDAFCADIAEMERERGRFTRPRFSPGYGDLPLSLQPEILTLLEAEKRAGIVLGESLLMSPSKSVTAFAGLRPGGLPSEDPGVCRQRCADCTLGNCIYRRDPIHGIS